MKIFKGDCDLYQDGKRICSGSYEVQNIMDQSAQEAQVGILEVNDAKYSALNELTRPRLISDGYQLWIDGKKFSIRLKYINGSADFDKGSGKFIFEFKDWYGEFK